MHQAFDAGSCRIMAPKNAESVIVDWFDRLSCEKRKIIKACVSVEATEYGINDVGKPLIKNLIEANALSNWSKKVEEYN